MSQKNEPARREQTRIEATFQGEAFFGPLPHPDLLIKFNTAVPDAAERILRMAESQAAHRQDIEKRVVWSNTLNQTMGTIFAFLITSGAIGGGIYLISTGANVSGFVTIITALGSLVTVFIKGRSAQDRERREKREALTRKR